MQSVVLWGGLCACLATILCTNAMVTTAAEKYEVVYSWAALDYAWANDSMKQEYITNLKYTPQTNLPSAIKVYKGEVYVTVPRFFSGVPATLNKVVISADKKPLLQPFPSWDVHSIGDCQSFQFIQAMEIDPNTGLMWIVDIGRSGIFSNGVLNSCPAKLIIYDLDNQMEVKRYEFPDTVVSGTANYINDIVLDYVDNKVAYVYMTDTGKAGLVVYDVKANTSYRFEDDATMSVEEDMPIVIDGIDFAPTVPINGIAMSSDFRYVYFSPVIGISLYQVPTSALRAPSTNISAVVRKVGEKPSQSDGMMYGKKNLYFGGLNDSSLYRWDVAKDVKNSLMMSEGKVTLGSVDAILKNISEITWIDTFAIDENGYLWFTSANVGRTFLGTLNFTSATPNFRIMKTHIDEVSYLNRKDIDDKDSDEESGLKIGPCNSANTLAWRHLYHFVLFISLTHRLFY